MPTIDDKLAAGFGKHASHGSLFISSPEQLEQEQVLLPYVHYLRQAWEELKLDGVLCVDGRPTVYLCEAKRFSVEQKRKSQVFVWNQGLVPLLVFLTPGQVEVHSGVRMPSKASAPEGQPERTLIPDLGHLADALEGAKFVRSIETGQFFHDHRDFFPTEEAVDRCLVQNLVDAARRLKKAGWKLQRAHSLLGRVLFVSFLQQRKFIKPQHFPAGTSSLLGIGVAARIEAKRDDLRLLAASQLTESALKQHVESGLPGTLLGETQHTLVSHSLRLFHLLLPVRRSSGSSLSSVVSDENRKQ